MVIKPPPAHQTLTANLSTPAGRIADLFRSHWGQAAESFSIQGEGLRAAQEGNFGLASTTVPWGGLKFDAELRSSVLKQIELAVTELGAMAPNNPTDAMRTTFAKWPASLRREFQEILLSPDADMRYSAGDVMKLGQADRINLWHALLVEGDTSVRSAVQTLVQEQVKSLTPDEISDGISAHRFATRVLFGKAPVASGRFAPAATNNELQTKGEVNVAVLPTKTGGLGFFFSLPSHPGFSPAKAAELLLAGTDLKQRGATERVGGQSDGSQAGKATADRDVHGPEAIGEQQRVSYSYSFEAVPKA